VKMWSGRFNQAPDAEFEEWQRSFPFDRILLPYEVAASKAHASALARAGVLTSEELAATLFALDQIGREGVPEVDDPAIEDVHHYVETRLVEIAGEVGSGVPNSRRVCARWGGSCTPAAAATSRLRPTCGCMCASRSTK
jgi:argininosuccinate lyase